MWRWLMLTGFMLLLVLAIGAGWLWQDMNRQLHAPLNIDTTQKLVLEPGTSLRALAQQLVSRGWLDHPYYLRFHARRTGHGNRLQAGEYSVEPGITPMQLLDKLIAGRVIQYALTVVEGWTYRDLLRAVQQHEHLDQTLPETLLDETIRNPEALMQALKLDGKHPEGQFFPDTYHFPAGTTDVKFLQRTHQMMQSVLTDEWQQREPDLPYEDAYEALIMASIIEKETAVPEERTDIAGVFVRRLEKGMKLQTDPTVIYALGQGYDGNIRRKDLKVDSPYNTYERTGLPPTPIALPGREAIHAALHPAPGKTLYFVSRGDGSHYFSETLQEHNRAVAKYQLGRDVKLKNE